MGVSSRGSLPQDSLPQDNNFNNIENDLDLLPPPLHNAKRNTQQAKRHTNMAIVQFLGTNTNHHNTWVHIGRDPSDCVVLGQRYIKGSGQKPEEDMERFFRRHTEERELRIAEESKDGKT